MIMQAILAFLVIGLHTFVLAEERSPSQVIVQIKQGAISGNLEGAENGRKAYAFKSIPYAQPPVGALRLKDPLPANGWTGLRDGSVIAPLCPQLNITAIRGGGMTTLGQEDCLYLNVFTPKTFPADLPVIVFLHGGAFLIGDVSDITPMPLVTDDVVVVTFHYRIGTLGFLSTEDSVIPGNFGLKDQTMALRWVKENIKSFGGDPNQVTLYGQSAGAAAAHMQVLSPHAEGLFQRVILQSGTALCPWTQREDHKQVALRTGLIFNCTSSPEAFDSVTFLQCMQSIPVEHLVFLSAQFVVWSLEPQVMMPRVDGDFLPADPAALLKEGSYNNVDIITGTTTHEGDLTTKVLYTSEELRDAFLGNFSVVGPIALNFKDSDENPQELARRVFLHYLGNITITAENSDQVTELFTDRLIAVCTDHTVQLHARNSAQGKGLYLYEFAHLGEFHFIPSFSRITANWVGHGDDLQYLFDSTSGLERLQRPDDLEMRRIIAKLLTNFAKTGNPTPDQSLGFLWTPVTTGNLSHLRLQTSPQMKNDERCEIRAFWENLPTARNKILFPEKFQPSQSTISRTQLQRGYLPPSF